MYILNNRGPNTEPWGTPYINSDHVLNEELIFALCETGIPGIVKMSIYHYSVAHKN